MSLPESWLIGSVTLHALLIAGVGLTLPSDPFAKETVVCFELVSQPVAENKVVTIKEQKTSEQSKSTSESDLKTVSGAEIKESIQNATGSDLIESDPVAATKISNQIPADNEIPKPNIVGNQGIGKENAAPDLRPAGLYRPNPKYPGLARKNNWEGTVVLKAEIMEDGRVGVVVVTESSGHDILDGEAVKTVRNWRYRPASQKEKSVNCRIQIKIRFKLEESS